MSNKPKELDKVQSAQKALIDVLRGETEKATAFARTSLLTMTNAMGAYLAANVGTLNEKGKPISREALIAPIVEPSGYSRANLLRYVFVAEQSKALPETSEGSASALYALTESGMTKAKAAYVAGAAKDAPKDANEVVARVTPLVGAAKKAIEAEKKKAIEAAKDVTPGDVEQAGYSPEAFAESIRELWAKVPAESQKDALAKVRAFVNSTAKELTPA